MSFAITTEQYRNRTKDVTRRLGWEFVKVGEVLNGVEKCQGLKKGEKVVKLGQHRVVTRHREPLNAITADDVRREGFPGQSPEWFIEKFCKANRAKRCTPETIITRIEYEYL
jgi:hypothetical protein